uniref:NADH dehydrogenase subunit 1 n=1 Tax=Austromenopon paululum TaxID=2965261 RepID=UPI0026E413FB|nr:NADH dehydrogenase subunit 1 [Austromenopon paululum]WJJ69863.1 NADH dehydrogenase subunit 1 [Austromenopon paululum]
MVLLVMVMLSVAFFSLIERKILSLIHYRKGPNKVSISGLLQPMADAMKLISKDDAPVSWSNKSLYYLSPVFMIFLSLVSWIVYPSVWGMGGQYHAFLLMIIILGLSVYGLMMSGWSPNSVYSVLGSIRAIAQSLSYEVVMSFVFLSVVVVVSSLSFSGFFRLNPTGLGLSILPLVLIMVFALIAELNRSPLDLAEGESELVSGYSVEYGGAMYTILFLSENIMIFFSSVILTFFFFSDLSSLAGGAMITTWSCVFCLIRGALPRIRYDKLMVICWEIILPTTLALFNMVGVLSIMSDMISSYI